MAADTASAQGPRRVWRFGDLVAWHPEWWMLAISVGAWLMIALSMSDSSGICSLASFGPNERLITRLRIRSMSSERSSEYIGWLLMTTAMMLPLTVIPLRHVAFRSFSWRRNRAVASFLVGYLMVWAFAGALLVPILIAARAFDGSGGRSTLTCGFALAAAWQLTPLKFRALRRCHRTVALSPTGWRADVDCVRFGVGTGSNCAFSCWALMLTPALASHSLLAMTCFQAIALHERYELRPRVRTVAPGLLMCAALFLLLGL